MQCKYHQILLGRTYEWSLWRGGRFIEVVFKTGSTVVSSSVIICCSSIKRKLNTSKNFICKLCKNGHTNKPQGQVACENDELEVVLSFCYLDRSYRGV